MIYCSLKITTNWHFELTNLRPNHIFESCNNLSITTHVCIYIYVGSDPLVHMDNKSTEGVTCKLMLSKECIDMDVNILNKRKVHEIIKLFHSLLTRSTERTCLAYASSSDDNQVPTMSEYSTTINCTCAFIRMRHNLCRNILTQIKRCKCDHTISSLCFKFGDYVYAEYHMYS